MKAFILLLLVVSCSKNKNVMIQNKGSDTSVNLAQAWAEEYRKINPNIAIAVSGGGSGTGISALINGTVDIANSSRPMKDEEKKAALKHNGVEVKEFVVAIDALAVFVNKNNPLKDLTFEEIACIYGENGTCTHWNQVRDTVVPGCEDNKIIRVSRQSNSGTYQYFREAVLGEKTDFKPGSMDMNGSKECVDLVEKTPCAIGYSGMGYLTSEVKTLCVSKVKGEDCVEPNLESAKSKKYPIARDIFMYTNGTPPKEVADYMKWTQSEAAKDIIIKSGFVPTL